MAGNVQPQFTQVGNIGSALCTAANTASDGTGNITTPTMYIVVTAGANGTYVESVRVFQVASAAATVAAANVVRIYASSITTGATSSANTFLIAEIPILSQTADQAAASILPFDAVLGYRLPANWTLLASIGTAANASTGYRVTGFGGDY